MKFERGQRVRVRYEGSQYDGELGRVLKVIDYEDTPFPYEVFPDSVTRGLYGLRLRETEMEAVDED